jgi:hypothetical protein
MKTGALIGARGKRYRPPPQVIDDAEKVIERLTEMRPISHRSLNEMKVDLSDFCRAYYALAACSRRNELEPDYRSQCLSSLFRLRTNLEKCILERLPLVSDRESVDGAMLTKSFFGISKKQGVSIRFPLLTCIPTATCGGGCYAHDGRDRELHLIFRACLNYYAATIWEDDIGLRAALGRRFEPVILYGVKMAIEDARSAKSEMGYVRAPRIRFSHLGEMVATPRFSNWIATQIKRLSPQVQCVAYSRHPNAKLYDPNLFVLNFTVDGSDDSRLPYAPSFAKIVSSSWNGVLSATADINFLEHHVEKRAEATGEGMICPVTIPQAAVHSCDEARCDRCFRIRQH